MVKEEVKIEEVAEEKNYYEKMKLKFRGIKIRESSRKSAFLSMLLLTIFFASVKALTTI